MALILTRRVGESVNIGQAVVVTVLDIFPSGRSTVARLSISAPPEIEVHRSEVQQRIAAGEPQKPKPERDTSYASAPVYVLVTRVQELHAWLREVVGIAAEPLVHKRMLVLCTSPNHVRGMTGFNYYVMPGTDPQLVAAAALRPGATRLSDPEMLAHVRQWRKHAPCDGDELARDG